MDGRTEGASERASRGGKKRRNKEAPEERKRSRGEWPDIGTEKEGKRGRERESRAAGRKKLSVALDGGRIGYKTASGEGREKAGEGGREGRRRGRN